MKHYLKTSGFSWVWLCTPVLSAPPEAEVWERGSGVCGQPGQSSEFRNIQNGPEKFVQSGECLPSKRENLSSVSRLQFFVYLLIYFVLFFKGGYSDVDWRERQR